MASTRVTDILPGAAGVSVCRGLVRIMNSTSGGGVRRTRLISGVGGLKGITVGLTGGVPNLTILFWAIWETEVLLFHVLLVTAACRRCNGVGGLVGS